MSDLPPLAAISALEIRLGVPVGSLAAEDLARAQANVEDASALVRAESGRSYVDPTDGVTITAPAAVVLVVVQAALRAYRNPDGFAGEGMGGGAYSYSMAPSAVGVYLTDDEVRVVKRASGGVQTVRVRSAYYDPRTWPLTGGSLLP